MAPPVTHANKNFDAPRPGSAFGSAGALIGAGWPIFAALLVVASVVELLAAGVLCIDAIGSRAVDASIGSIAVFATVDPQASQADVDALGPLVRATPGVAEAIFRSKDDAIKSMVARGLPAADGRNPLPDVWVARLDPARIGPGRSVTTAIAEMRRALAGLPRVESVTTDEAWVDSTERLAGRWHQGRPLIWIGSGVLLTLVLAGAAFLAGTGLTTGASESAILVRVLAIAGTMTLVLSVVIAYAVGWLLIGRWNMGQPATLEGSFVEILVSHPGAVSGIIALSTVILVGGLIAGHHRAA